MPKTLLPHMPLLPLALALLLVGCQTADPHRPDAARFAPVALPTQPAGEADCGGQRCLSQRQVDQLFNATIDALCAANDKLAWLSDFYLGTTLPPSCAPD